MRSRALLVNLKGNTVVLGNVHGILSCLAVYSPPTPEKRGLDDSRTLRSSFIIVVVHVEGIVDQTLKGVSLLSSI